jgi:hypothetical protein
MNIDDIIKSQMAVPEYDDTVQDAERKLKEYLAYNNFTLFDSELADKRKQDYFYMEMDFFSDIISITKKYLNHVPNIRFLPRRFFDFKMSVGTIGAEKILFAEELVLSFLTEFSCYAFYLSMKETREKDDIRPFKRRMIAMIDIFVFRKKNTDFDEITMEVIGKNEHSTKFACFMARAMYTYILCHEIAHAVINYKGEKSLQNEFDADALGYEIFYSLILNSDNLKHLEFFPGLRRAPIALFDIFDLIDYFKREILDNYTVDTSHPAPFLRKAALLEQFDFGDDEESFNLYLVISERVSALKYYIYKNREVMKKEISKIHESDFVE